MVSVNYKYYKLNEIKGVREKKVLNSKFYL